MIIKTFIPSTIFSQIYFSGKTFILLIVSLTILKLYPATNKFIIKLTIGTIVRIIPVIPILCKDIPKAGKKVAKLAIITNIPKINNLFQSVLKEK
ncbi:hypothetical protein ALNOE001_20320 [Candidatus Methanobinarius endosymbioticus]|uniref:Uncharacterized protein n=1 Tax=Candidatus Methanobinarius endosymbioticus TaxID=2006182 RepID=A0A366M9Y0_9EURY|nr:hypothetical protein ALNOE001_20320 [Candidatus Methanobinarius endosymbioticus]